MAVAMHVQSIIKGLRGSQAVNNILWWRGLSEDADPTALAIDVAAGLGSTFTDHWLAGMSQHYLLHSFDIQLYTGLWEPLLFLPYSSVIDAPGTVAGDLAGPAQVAILKFGMDPATALVPAGTKRPKRSYIAFGPIPENDILDDGTFQGNSYAAGALANILYDLSHMNDFGGDMGECFPERVGAPLETGERASMLVTTASFRAKSSFRRSRNN